MNKNKWGFQDIPDLTGKRIIVTGGNSGLGLESVRAFASKGAEVILACRSSEKGEKEKNTILTEHPKAKIHVMVLDLMDLSSVKHFAEEFHSQFKSLDILLNNAGIMMNPYQLTKDGYESQIGTNHLGHFALTGLLIDSLKNAPGSRVVNVSSNAHKYGQMDFNNLLFENGKDYSPIKAYSRSKLANLLFTYELNKRFEQSGIKSISLAAHPGVSRTNLARFLEHKIGFKLIYPLFVIFTQNAKNGALPQIRAAVDTQAKAGEYYGPGGFSQMKGHPIVVSSNAESHNSEDARKLWEYSESLTGIKFLS